MWAVEINLDPESDERVRSLWAAIDHHGVESLGSVPGTAYRPHVSLAVFRRGDLNELKAALTPVLRPCIGLPLTLASLGFFVSPDLVAFLGVTPTRRLLDAHRRVHAAIDGVARDVWPLYEPGTFVPHCTLAMRPADPAPIVSAVGAQRMPIAAVAHEVHLVEISTGRSHARLT